MHLRSRHLILFDVLAILTSFALSFVMRFDTGYIWPQLTQYWPLIVPMALVKLAAFYRFGLYRRVWRYASTPEMVAIVAAATASSIVVAFIIIWGSTPEGPEFVYGFPRSLIAIDFLLTVAFVGGSRFGLRVVEESRRSPRSEKLKGWREPQKRVLVVGAGDAGVMIVREMKSNPGLGVLPIGFVDDDRRKMGMHIRGVPVLGTLLDLPDLIAQHQVDEVMIAMPTAPGKVIRDLIHVCRGAGVTCKTMPGIYELIDGRVSLSQVRDVRLEDLLRREPVNLHGEALSALLTGKRVLITGAGGSIGSELCRQVAKFRPAELIVVGRGENSIFEIDRELRAYFPHVKTQPVIASVCDAKRIDSVIRDAEPHLVFHSAAHKHVPLMEANAAEAIRNNVMGTRNVALAAKRYGVGRFVLISTDKAVNPTSVMGASKRAAELVVQELAVAGRQSPGRTRTIFTAVRFGNVLGSRGSFIPILREQILAGGPITITHPEITRYFMTIPEAAKLVVHAASLAEGGEVFVLDMGEPVRIVDLAHDLVELCGLQAGRDVEIVYTGLRPGEKLHEELVRSSEGLAPTAVSKVLVLRPHPVNGVLLRRWLDSVAGLVDGDDDLAVRLKLKELVPEYQWQLSTEPESELSTS